MKRNILLLLFFVAGLTCYDSQLQAALPKPPIQREIIYPFAQRMQQLNTVVSDVKSIIERVLDPSHSEHISSAQAQNILKKKYREVLNPNLLQHAQKAKNTAKTENKTKVNVQFAEFESGLKSAGQLIVDTMAENMTKFLDLVETKSVEYESGGNQLDDFTRLAGHVGAVSASKLAPGGYDLDYSKYDPTCARHKDVYLDVLQRDPSNVSARKFGRHMPAVDVGIKIAKPVGKACVYVADKVVWGVPRAANWSVEMAECAGDAWSQKSVVAGTYDGLSPVVGLGLAGMFVRKAWMQSKGKGRGIPMRLLCTAANLTFSPKMLAGTVCSIIGATASLQHINANKKRNDGFFYDQDDQNSSSTAGLMRIVSAAALAGSAYCYKNIKEPAIKKPVSLKDGIVKGIRDLMKEGVDKFFTDFDISSATVDTSTVT